MKGFSVYKDLLFLILQFCEEENLKRTARMLEQEAHLFFNFDHLEDLVLNKRWDEAENYISSFMKVEDGESSMTAFFIIRRQKYIQALAQKDYTMALNILHNELLAFPKIDSNWNGTHEQLAQLLAYNDSSKPEHNSAIHGEVTMSARKRVMKELEMAIKSCQIDGLTSFPEINPSRLKRLINQGLSWQHSLCEHPHPRIAFSTLFSDHKCLRRDGIDNRLAQGSSSFIKPLDEVFLLQKQEHYLLKTIFCRERLLEPLSVQKQDLQNLQSELISSGNDCKEIRGLAYTSYAGVVDGILSLSDNGVHVLWRWSKSDTNGTGEATTKCAPRLVTKLRNGPEITNDAPGPVSHCFSVSQDGRRVISVSGQIITLYNMTKQLEKAKDIRLPPNSCAATCVMFYPPNNDLVLFGMEDAKIIAYNIHGGEVEVLEGHSSRVSGLAFSSSCHALISADANNQIVVRNTLNWEEKKSVVLQMSIGWSASEESATTIAICKDEREFLAVHESRLAIYEVKSLECVRQWAVDNYGPRVHHAAFSSDKKLIYALTSDRIVTILDALSLTPRSTIDTSAYLPSPVSFVHPVVVAAHPSKRYQFALGLSNGEVAVMDHEESFSGTRKSESLSVL